MPLCFTPQKIAPGTHQQEAGTSLEAMENKKHFLLLQET